MLTKMPDSVLLNLEIDKNLLLRDFKAIDQFIWQKQIPFTTEGLDFLNTTAYHGGDWNIISLRSQGGDWKRTDPGGPGMSDYYFTEVAHNMPYVLSLLKGLGCYMRTVRLSRIPANSVINRHCDTFHHFKFGQIRLQLPICTHEDAEIWINNKKYSWGVGELWYGDFSKPHWVINKSPIDRVTILIDVTINNNIIDLFPSNIQHLIFNQHPIFHKNRIFISESKLKRFECKLILHSALTKGIFETDDGIPGEFIVEIKLLGEDLVFYLDNKPLYKLIPFEENKFYFLGWNLERYIELSSEYPNKLKIYFYNGNKKTFIEVETYPI